jgi:hypothetical protein
VRLGRRPGLAVATFLGFGAASAAEKLATPIDSVGFGAACHAEGRGFEPRRSRHDASWEFRLVRQRRDAFLCDEVSAVHSMTSSADTMIEFGKVKPSVLAVFMLTTISNLVGRSIGKSDGWAPLRMRST